MRQNYKKMCEHSLEVINNRIQSKEFKIDTYVYNPDGKLRIRVVKRYFENGAVSNLSNVVFSYSALFDMLNFLWELDANKIIKIGE